MSFRTNRHIASTGHFPLRRQLAKITGPFVALALLSTQGQAQIRLEIGAGVTATSRLVSDSIVSPIDVGMNPGFAASFRLATVLDSTYTLQLGMVLSRNTMVRKVMGAEPADITSVNVWFPSVGLRRKLVGPMSIRGTLGALIYDAEDTVGTPFRDGSPILAAAGLGITYVPGFTNGLSVDVAWDIHRFNTAALRLEGFGGDQIVHRITLLLQLGGSNTN